MLLLLLLLMCGSSWDVGFCWCFNELIKWVEFHAVIVSAPEEFAQVKGEVVFWDTSFGKFLLDTTPVRLDCLGVCSGVRVNVVMFMYDREVGEAVVCQLVVGFPAVGYNCCSRFNVFFDELRESGGITDIVRADLQSKFSAPAFVAIVTRLNFDHSQNPVAVD